MSASRRSFLGMILAAPLAPKVAPFVQEAPLANEIITRYTHVSYGKNFLVEQMDADMVAKIEAVCADAMNRAFVETSQRIFRGQA